MPRKPSCLCGACKKCRHREYMRRWQSTPEGRAYMAAKRRRWYERNHAKALADSAQARQEAPMFKRRAQNKVAWAIKRGLLVRPDVCERCGEACKPVAHHDDYARSLEVEWLCRSCHAREHSPYDEEAA